MKYLRIKPCFDQKTRSDGSILIGRELYTEREARKFAIPSECYDVVAVPKTKTYWCFGARFMEGEKAWG
jgi:hypothetical protein